MAKIIAIENQKGGVGKSTTSYNLAAGLALRGKRTLMCDVDAHCSLTISAGISPISEDIEASIVDVFENPSANIVADAVYETNIENLSIMVSHPMLAQTELKLISMTNREKRLGKALKLIESAFDYIILDCPPQLGLVTINTLSCADFVLIPAECSEISYFILQYLLSTIDECKEELNPELEMLGFVASMFDKRASLDREVLEMMQKEHDVLVVLKRTTTVKKGLKEGLPAVVKEKNSEIAKEYMKLVDKIIARVG